MVLRRGMRSPVKAAARTAMSTGFSFAPARRRSREAWRRRPQRVTGIPQIDPTASAHQEASERWLRQPCEMPARITELVREAQRWWPKPFRGGWKVWSAQAAKSSKPAKLVGSPSESGPIVDRCGFFSLGPKSDIGLTALVHPHSRLLPRPWIENRSRNLATCIPNEGNPRVVAVGHIEFCGRNRCHGDRLSFLEVEDWPKSR
jgi:hypothetical protein